MLFIHKKEEIEVDILKINLRVEKKKREINANLRLQYIWDIVKSQVFYKV